MVDKRPGTPSEHLRPEQLAGARAAKSETEREAQLAHQHQQLEQPASLEADRAEIPALPQRPQPLAIAVAGGTDREAAFQGQIYRTGSRHALASPPDLDVPDAI